MVATAAEELAEKSDAICRMGSLMLSSGTGSYRVKAAMGRVSAALGIDDLEVQVSLTEIVATTRVSGAFRTQVVEVPVPVVDADRIGALMEVSLRAGQGLTASDLQQSLDEVAARRHRYRPWWVVLGAALACAAFAFLNNGGWPESLAAGLGAAVGKSAQVVLRRFRLNQLAVVALAATLAGLTFVAMAQLMALLLPDMAVHEAAFISALLFLVPGFPLLTAALDLARFDFTSGISRLLYATTITFAAALGAWLVAGAFDLTPAAVPNLELSPVVLWLLRAVAGFVGVLGFALTFQTPLKVAIAASVTGMVANLARLLGLDLGWDPLVCATAASVLVGLLAGWLSQHLPSPRIIVSVPAVLIMIPGAATYRALVAVIDQDPLAALVHGSSALGIVVGLAAGLAIARMLTDPVWMQSSPTWTRMPTTRAQRRLRAGSPS